MNRFQFDRIFSYMKKDFGSFNRNELDDYALIFFPIESNALKIHRAHHESNSRRFQEALALVLYDIKGRLDGKQYDTSAFRNEDNERLEHAILMAVDPYTNDELRAVLVASRYSEEDLADPTSDAMREYYEIPVKCLLKLKESASLWEAERGSNGYFDFIEGYMGDKIKGNEMDYTVLATEVITSKASRPIRKARH